MNTFLIKSFLIHSIALTEISTDTPRDLKEKKHAYRANIEPPPFLEVIKLFLPPNYIRQYRNPETHLYYFYHEKTINITLCVIKKKCSKIKIIQNSTYTAACILITIKNKNKNRTIFPNSKSFEFQSYLAGAGNAPRARALPPDSEYIVNDGS